MTGKIFRNAFLVGITALALCAALFLWVQYGYYERQAFNQLSVEADYIAHGMDCGEDYLRTLQARDRVTWVAADGTVLYDSAADAASMANHADREEIAEALANGSGESAHYSDTLLQRTLYYAERLADGTVIRVSCTQSSVAAVLMGMLWPIAGIICLALALSILLSYRLARQIVRPINELDLDHPESGRTYPELEPLVTRIREQNRTIRQQMDELSLKQREFAAITDNMREGFLLVDSRMNILSSNHSALLLLSPEGAAAANLRESGRGSEICGAVETALAGGRAETLLTAGAAAIQIIANPVFSHGQVTGAVVMMIDVTEREQREALRREFSANVSHELKTPLTSISGFAELMKEGLVPPEKVKEFSGDIYRESQRLMDLVDDIINLSRLDENTSTFQKEPVDLYELADEILANLRPVAEKRGVTLKLAGYHATINGVWQVLQEMVYNLCDNAIKYNVEGGTVTVSVTRWSEHETRLSVTDTGIGIPYADQGRVFERFYRVDKSHSKEIGGTGLGLSIVKHAAQYHNARVELQSEPDVGTTVTVIF